MEGVEVLMVLDQKLQAVSLDKFVRVVWLRRNIHAYDLVKASPFVAL